MVRVGIIDFVNAYPLFYGFTHGKVSLPKNVTFSFGRPSKINALLKNGELDVAITSSIHFLENRFEYTLLSDLGIAATQEVMSIRLFSKKPPQSLHGARVLIPSESSSSVKMLQVLFSHFWKVSPQYEVYQKSSEGFFEQDDPFLVIGDDCLKFSDAHPKFPALDLAEHFFLATQKSSVFALIATRNESLKSSPNQIIEVHRSIDDSFSWWKNNKQVVTKEAARSICVQEPLLEKYYSVLEYELAPKHFHGLDFLATM